MSLTILKVIMQCLEKVNSLNNKFYDYLIKSLKVNDNLVKLNNDILMIKKVKRRIY